MPSTRRAADPAPPRGITASDVDRAADALLRAGERPTIEKVRLKIGRGSPNTINPLLDAWWSRLAGRLDAGPAALHRLPQAVAMAAEALWINALESARERAAQEHRSTKTRLSREQRELQVASHVLSIREAELADRLGERERRIETLETELEAILTMLRKEQASRAALERRLTAESTWTLRPASTRAARRKTTATRTPGRRKAAAKRAPARRKTAANKTPGRRKAAVKNVPARRKRKTAPQSARGKTRSTAKPRKQARK